jgi:UDP-N-acetylmuramyl pentapeptide synthase
LGVRPWHRFGVFELSGHQPGALDGALATVRPTVGVVTWIGRDHWKAFGDEARVAAEKGKMVACLPPGGRAVLNADDPAVAAMATRTRAPVLRFGIASEADVRAEAVHCAFPERLSMTVRHAGEALRLHTRLVGEHMAYPVLAAIAVGLGCGVPLRECVRQLDGAEGRHHRLSVHEAPGGVTFLLDSRKASGWALEAAFRTLELAHAKRKIVVIGTISDYAGSTSRAYRRAARRALEVADRVYFVGPNSPRVRNEAPSDGKRELRIFPHALALHEFLRDRLEPGDLVLLKSSLADHVERIFEAQAGPHACWKAPCQLKRVCGACRHRLVPSDPPAPGAERLDAAQA